jgi:hypothetical protein
MDQGLANEVESLWPVDHCVGHKTGVEGRQLASAFQCKCEQVTIRDLRGVEKTAAVDTACIQQRNVVRPEFVTGQGSQRCKQLGNGRRSACGVRISSVANDAQQAIFGERAGRPSLLPARSKPFVRAVVLNVCWIDERNQDLMSRRKRVTATPRAVGELTRKSPFASLRAP